jgi:hypothetical protein
MPELSDPIDQLSRIDEINYPEFTSKLISDTFDAIVASMIRQQEAYADLVEKVSMTLGDFSSEAVTDTDVETYLRTYFPGDEDNGTSVGSPSDPGELDDADAARLASLLGPEAIETGDEANLPEEGSLDAADVELIFRLVRRMLARPRLDALRERGSQGVTRIVVEDGTIETELEFRTYANVEDVTASSSYQRNTLNGGGGLNFASGLFGINLGGSGSRLRVSTNRSSRASEGEAEGEIKGRVEINFRGESQPFALPDAEEPEVVVTP